jgi:hypothetical protein
MMVNGKQIEVINSSLAEAERELDWAVDHLARALERRERVPMLERMKAALIQAFAPLRDTATTHAKETVMDTEKFEALSAKVNALAEAQTKIGDVIANAVAAAVKPLTDNLAEMQANQKAQEDAELAGHVATIVKANLLDEASAKELTINAARKLAEKAKPGKAAGLNPAFMAANADDEFAGVDLNAVLEAK